MSLSTQAAKAISITADPGNIQPAATKQMRDASPDSRDQLIETIRKNVEAWTKLDQPLPKSNQSGRLL